MYYSTTLQLSRLVYLVYTWNGPWIFHDYSLIAFDERVTFWLKRVRSLPCACAYVALLVRRLAYNHYAIAHVYNAANTHAQGSRPGTLKPKRYSLVEGNQTIACVPSWTKLTLTNKQTNIFGYK